MGGFVKSKWCMFETELAHDRMNATEENKKKKNENILVVIKEKPTKKDKLIDSILATVTYLKWNENKRDNFYSKLQSSILGLPSTKLQEQLRNKDIVSANEKWDEKSEKWDEKNEKWDEKSEKWDEKIEKWDEKNEKWNEKREKGGEKKKK